MRTQRVSWTVLWVVVLALPLGWSGKAQAGQIIWIKFDDLPDGLRVDDHYAQHEPGVHFVNDFFAGS